MVEERKEEQVGVSPPDTSMVNIDFFERHKPLMLEEMIDNRSFSLKCSFYFNELGYANIFTMSEKDIDPDKIRQTIDTIYSQYYTALAEIGLYYTEFSSGKSGRLRDSFKSFARELWHMMMQRNSLEKIEQRELNDEIFRKMMVAFLDQSREEFNYLESQIQLVEYNLSDIEGRNREHKTWSGAEHANNLFNLHLPYNMFEEQNMARQQRLIEYLKRIVFKLIVGIERIEYYVNGWIRGRDEMLRVRDARIISFIHNDDPFVEGKIEELKLKYSQMKHEEKLSMDLMGAFTIQILIKEQIDHLKKQNVEKKCLADRLQPLHNNPKLRPDPLNRPFSRYGEERKKLIISKPPKWFGELCKWQKAPPRKNRKSNQDINNDEEKRQSDVLMEQSIKFAKQEQVEGAQLLAQEELLKDLLFALAQGKNVVDAASQQHIFESICASRVTGIHQDPVQLNILVSKSCDELCAMQQISKKNEQWLSTRLQTLTQNSITFAGSDDHLEKKEVFAWRAMPMILKIICFFNRRLGKEQDSIAFMTELKITIIGKLEQFKNNEWVTFFFEQNLITNFPLIFESIVEECLTDDNQDDLVSFLERVLLNLPEYKKSQKDLRKGESNNVDYNDKYCLSNNYEGKKRRHEEENDVVGIAQNSYVNRVMAMAKILGGRAITRMHYAHQSSIARTFCDYVDKHLQDIRRRQKRSDLLQIVDEHQDRYKNELMTNEKLIYFLRSYFKWELSLLQQPEDRISQECLDKQHESLGFLTQNFDLFFEMVEQKTSFFVNKYVAQVVFYRLIQSIMHSQLEQLFQVRLKNRIKSVLQRISGALYKNDFQFLSPFEYYHKRIRCKLVANLSFMISQQLMKILQYSNEELRNEYAEIFAHNWYIMLFTSCDLREQEIEKQAKNEKVQKVDFVRNDKSVFESSEIQAVIKRYGDTLRQAKQQSLLMPSREFAELELKKQYLVKLIKQVEKDYNMGNSQALEAILNFLCAYTDVTAKLIQKQQKVSETARADKRQINVLAMLCKLADQLKTSSTYSQYAREYLDMLDPKHDSFLMKKFKGAIKLVFGIDIKEEDVLRKQNSLDPWWKDEFCMENYLVGVCKKFRAVERRLLICELNDKNDATDSFYGVYCKYKLLEAKLDNRILHEMNSRPSNEAEKLIVAYEQLRHVTYEKIEVDDDDGAKNKDRVEQSFLITERAFLHKEIFDYMLEENLQGKKDNFKLNQIADYGDQVIKELEGFDYQRNMIQQHQQPNYPLQAAQIKLAELDRLFNRTQIKESQHQITEEEAKEKILDKFDQLYKHILSRKEDQPEFVQIERGSEVKKRAARPELPWYYIIQFYGQDFEPELTRQSNGFIFRGLQRANVGSETDYWSIVKFLKALFPKLGNRLDFSTRVCLDDKVEKYPNLDRDQATPLIVLTENIKPLTSKMKAKYGDMSKDIKRIKLEECTQEGKRENFKKMHGLNFKRYFTKKVTNNNPEFVRKAKIKFDDKLKELCGEEDPQTVSQENVKKVYDVIRAWQGDFVADGMPKNCDEFWDRVYQKAKVSKNAEEVGRQFVEEQVVKMYQALKYDDLCLQIFEVPKQFPFGFLMQPMRPPGKISINGARYAESVVFSWKKEIDQLTKQNSHEDLYKAILGKLVANVQGGLGSYICIFFAQDGYHLLDSSNDQYYDILRLFTQLDKLFPVIQTGIDCLVAAKNQFQEDSFVEVTQIWKNWNLEQLQQILDGYTQRHFENLERLDIDEKLREEAAHIFQLVNENEAQDQNKQ